MNGRFSCLSCSSAQFAIQIPSLAASWLSGCRIGWECPIEAMINDEARPRGPRPVAAMWVLLTTSCG